MSSKPIFLALILGLLLASNQGFSTQASEPAEHEVTDLPPVVHYPSMEAATSAFMRSSLSEVAAKITVTYDAEGKVRSAEILEKSGNRGVDKELMNWARKLRLKPGAAGSGVVPVRLFKSGETRSRPKYI